MRINTGWDSLACFDSASSGDIKINIPDLWSMVNQNKSNTSKRFRIFIQQVPEILLVKKCIRIKLGVPRR